MAQTTAPDHASPFDHVRLLNDDRSQYFTRVIDRLADRLAEDLSRWLNDLSITPKKAEQVLIHEVATPDSDVVVITSDNHLGHGAVVSDLNLALSMITIMCGGHPNPSPDIRPLTRVEAEVYRLILEPIVERAVQMFAVGPTSLGNHGAGAAVLTEAGRQHGIAIPLEMHLGETSGDITLALTANQVQAFIEDIDRRLAGRQASRQAQRNEIVAKATKAVPLEMIVGFEPARIPAGVLADLREGDVLRTGQMMTQSLIARIGSERVFSVRAAQRGQRLVVEVTGRIASNEGVL